MIPPHCALSVPAEASKQRHAALDGFPVTLLPGRGLDRKFSGRSLRANTQALAEGFTAIAMALYLFSKWRPAVVISLGGYASLGCVVAAYLWRIPIVVINVDAVPGAVNRLAARAAAASAVASLEVRLGPSRSDGSTCTR